MQGLCDGCGVKELWWLCLVEQKGELGSLAGGVPCLRSKRGCLSTPVSLRNRDGLVAGVLTESGQAFRPRDN